MRVLTRDAERAEELAGRGAEVAIGDLRDAESLAAAHDGVESVVVHLQLQYDFELHEAYGRNAIDAAAAAGVSMLVFNTSAHVLQGTDVTVYQVRQRMVDLLRGSGVPNVVLRPTFYLDNLLGPWIKPGIVEQGVLAFPLPPEFRMSWVASQEVGAYAAAAVAHRDLAGCVFDIGGPQGVTGEELAACLTGTIGRPVRYVGIPPDAYQQALVPLFGDAVAFEVAEQIRAIVSLGDGTVDMTEPHMRLGVVPVSAEEWISQQEWVAAPR